ncbi:restriction endonuclease subunit S [Polaribacter pectinis]|uniref:Restriction endonuclease subunit S n=1 Tax=Polaribacter pectinis TaxID=2738844 RepID=A0A7G9L7J4_9FLAO|nr:restriction endonuclease subunit S [Polaribacter pectinis]QNM84593.1 restriction endonuclease subunit S [Polaribacter pectinis]
MKKYDVYKESGVDWIDKIPENWNIAKLKYNANISFSSVDRHQYETERRVEICHYPDAYKNEVIDESTNLSVGSCTQNEFEKFQLKKDQVIITKDSESANDIGVPTYVLKTLENAVCGYHLAIIETNKNILSGKYIFRYLQINIVKTYFELNSNGVTRFGLGKPTIMNLSVPIIPLQEQNKINTYLDHKTTIIDALIDKKELLIKKLQAQRQAIINEAVTKGLNNNAKMKSSGIEWLGEIPEHWDMVKLTWLTDFITCGLAATPKYVEDNEGVPFLSAQNVKPGRIKLHKYRFISKELHQKLTKIRKPQKGDLLVTRVGAGIGEAAVVDIDFEFSVYVSLTHIRTNQKLLSTFLMYFFSTEYAKNLALEGTVEGGGQGNLNVKNVENYRIALPTLKEQQDIVKFLNSSTKKIDEAIRQSQDSIKKLKSYRQAIISEAVTGKIDVRDWQAPKNN